MAGLNEFFQRNHEEYHADQMVERPSTEITFTIRLNEINNPYVDLRKLSIELWSQSMKLSPSNSNRDIVIISGIPSEYGFGEHELMEVVKKHIQKAEVVPESPHRGGAKGVTYHYFIVGLPYSFVHASPSSPQLHTLQLHLVSMGI